jgi:hypothetical protein
MSMNLSSQENRTQKKLRGQVRAAFNPDALKHFCSMPESEFLAVSEYGELGGTRSQPYLFADRGASILAVAHLDCVQGKRFCEVVDTDTGKLILSPALDDRLGVYAILDLLPKLGAKCDVLLTTGEETGSTSARLFRDPPRQYNWMFQFDRAGTDMVMYDYMCPTYTALAAQVGVQVHKGLFSDICSLEHLGCAGMNWGVGYHDYHSSRAYAWWSDVVLNIGRFLSFYEKHHGKHLPDIAIRKRSKWKRTARGTLIWDGYESHDPRAPQSNIDEGDDLDSRFNDFDNWSPGAGAGWGNPPDTSSTLRINSKRGSRRGGRHRLVDNGRDYLPMLPPYTTED